MSYGQQEPCTPQGGQQPPIHALWLILATANAHHVGVGTLIRLPHLHAAQVQLFWWRLQIPVYIDIHKHT